MSIAAIWAALKNPWILLVIACVIGAGGTSWYRMEYLGQVAARAEDVAAAEKKVNEAKKADAAKTREIEDNHAAEVIYLKDQLNARNIGIANSASSAVCADSPAFQSLGDSLRARQARPGPRK